MSRSRNPKEVPKVSRVHRRSVLGTVAAAATLFGGLRAASAAPGGKSVYVLNGPNMDLLGKRQPELYGRETLQDVERLCRETGDRLGLGVEFRQTNSEGALVDHVHEAREKASAIVINAAAYAHTSVALQDALHACEIPVIEVHMTNTFKREAYRHTDYTAQVATAQINGCGANGYRLALEQVRHLLDKA